MKHSRAPSRRGFFAATAGALAAASLAPRAATAARAPRNSALKIGLASYSLKNLSLDKLIEACREAGIEYLTLKDVHLPRTATAEELAAARGKLDAAGITVMGGGVIYMKKNEQAVRKDFEYAKAAKLPLLVIAPDPDALDLVEAMVKEFDVPVAIHNHGPEDKFYPAPKDALALIKRRDRRIGLCMDIGHTIRAGSDPVKAVAACGDRLMDLHIKDLSDTTNKDAKVPVGRGKIDVAGVMRALHKRRFQGHVALEYELSEENVLPGIRESLGYMRGVAAALG